MEGSKVRKIFESKTKEIVKFIPETPEGNPRLKKY
jgi:hypothetical protein